MDIKDHYHTHMLCPHRCFYKLLYETSIMKTTLLESKQLLDSIRLSFYILHEGSFNFILKSFLMLHSMFPSCTEGEGLTKPVFSA